MDLFKSFGPDPTLDLSKLASAIRDPARALFRIGALVKDTARKYSPISPTSRAMKRQRLASQIRGMRASGLRGKPLMVAIRKYKSLSRKISSAKKKSGAVSRPKPGSLQNSIEFERSAGAVSVFVAANSPAGKYGRYIHDQGPHGTGKWKNRGLGTVRKGGQADDKFIERALKDNEAKIHAILEDEIAKQAGLD